MIKRLLAILVLCLLPSFAPAATTQTALAADSMTRANASTLGTNWANMNTANCLTTLTSNSAEAGSIGQTCLAVYSANDFPWDQFSQVKMATRANTSSIGAPCVHMINDPTGGGPLNVPNNMFGYCVSVAGNVYTIVRLDIGVGTTKCTSTTNPAAGDTILLTVQQTSSGQALTALVNGTALAACTSIIDNTYLNGIPGFFIVAATATTDIQVTNFSAGAVSTPPTIVNLPNGNGSGPTVLAGTPTQLGTITAMGQAVQFVPAPSTFTFGGRVQIIATGQISNPQWSLECSQDANRTWWFQMPAVALPTLSPQLQDSPPSLSTLYDISGLSAGSACRFGLGITTTTTITGNSVIWVIVG